MIFKKTAALIMALITASFFALSNAHADEIEYEESSSSYICVGDVDKDGSINSADSLNILRISVRLQSISSTEKSLADVDSDGRITSADSLDVLRYSVGMRVSSKVGKSTSIVKKTTNTACLNAYSDLLDSTYKNYPDGRFMLGDINGDSVPEMFLSTGYYHMATVMIYTYSGGKVVKVGEVGSFGSFSYVPGGNLIEDSMNTAMVDENTGGFYAAYLKMNGTKLEKILSCNTNSNAGGSRYVVNNKRVSKSEYDRTLKPYKSKNFVKADYNNGYILSFKNICYMPSYPANYANLSDYRVKNIL